MLLKLFLDAQTTSRQSADSRARRICSAVKLNTKNGRSAEQPSQGSLSEAGVPQELAKFVTEMLERAKNAAIAAKTPCSRAHAVTAALGLNYPVGAPLAGNRKSQRKPRFREIFIATSSAVIGKVEVEELSPTALSAEFIVNAVEGILECTPPEKRNVRAACREIAERYHRDWASIEATYHANKHSHSRFLEIPSRKKCGN